VELPVEQAAGGDALFRSTAVQWVPTPGNCTGRRR